MMYKLLIFNNFNNLEKRKSKAGERIVASMVLALKLYSTKV